MKRVAIKAGVRDISPCKDCTEKFQACHDVCPKDQRGEYGYAAWRVELERVKQERNSYVNNLRNYKWR